MKNKEVIYKSLFLSFSVFIFSFYFYPFYYLGDQAHYRSFYKLMQYEESIGGSAYLLKSMLGTYEPGYLLLVYIFCEWLNKDLLFSIVNAIFLYPIFHWMMNNRVSYVFIFFIFTNFYILVLFFAAERLKVSLLFLLISACTVRCSYLFTFFSVFTHIQSFLLVLSLRIIKIKEEILLFLKGQVKKDLVFSIVGLLFLILIMSTLGYGHIIDKMNYYLKSSGGFNELIKPLIFLILSLYYASPNEKLVAFLSVLPIIILSYFISSDRLVIFSYFIFMYFGLRVNRGINIGVLTTSFYFTYKGFFFIKHMIFCGESFGCVI